MRYAGMIKNDIAAAPGVCVSFFTQGCPFHCEGCHNPDTWDYDGGREFTSTTMQELLQALRANGIERNLCIMGGEPMCDRNTPLVKWIVSTVKEYYPSIKIYLWTGYQLEDLVTRYDNNINEILDTVDCVIDGRFILSERDITLHMRGSRNQNIWYKGDVNEWVKE